MYTLPSMPISRRHEQGRGNLHNAFLGVHCPRPCRFGSNWRKHVSLVRLSLGSNETSVEADRT
jgi:hypothetical protein